MKTKILLLALLFNLIGQIHAANFVISNVNNGETDTLYANSGNSLLTAGIVTLGVFDSGFDVAANLTNKTALLGSYGNLTPVFTSGTIGGTSASLGSGNWAGYAEHPSVDGSPILTGNALIGRTLYSFIGNAGTLAESTQFALLNMGLIQNEDGGELDFSSNPQFVVNPGGPGSGTLIGSYGTLTNAGFGGQGAGSFTFTTLQLQAIPEPSTFLLATLGVFALLRRRR